MILAVRCARRVGHASRRTPVPVLTLLSLALAATGAAAQSNGPRTEARAVLDSLMAAAAIPGMSLAVGVDGEVVWSEGLGWADVEAHRPVTTATLFRVGSVSKPMTAIGLGLLIDSGLVDLDLPVQVYVPDFPRKRWPVTTRQLGGHIAGVRHYRNDEFLGAVHYPDVRSGLAIFENDSLLFEPGTDYSYSSYGWNLIGAVVEGASGEPFLAFMASRVFIPLGMEATVPDQVGEPMPERTSFYELNEEGRVVRAPEVDNSYKWASGGFLSTPEDLIHLSRGVLGPGFLSAETLETLLTTQRLRDGTETGYGIGWREGRSTEGHRVASHTGGSVGGTTLLWIDRDTGLAVAITANRGDAPVTHFSLAERIAEAFQPVAAGAN